ncbi:beta-ketoacyl synthase N-terminal-like domain-containing protein [Leifsonia sp. McL0607]|uniref:beta-ketoacyl synthase N-terminal-like domain-containing protein n=1 Tax=Leifsonia sp. McL0607 TaxID=3415672 RepID=UPI003CEB0481
MSMRDDIVITGIGLLTAAGLTVEENWTSIRHGRAAFGRPTTVSAHGLTSDRVAELPGGDKWVPRSAYARGELDRCHAIALDAVAEALDSAGLAVDDALGGYAPERVAISLGTSLGGSRSGEAFHRTWLERGVSRANPAALLQYPLHSVADVIAEQFGAQGPRTVHSNACAAGTVSIAYALELIESGAADAAIAGGVDPIAYFSYAGFSCLGALDARQCAPYTRSSGLNLGEGAGVVILERRSAALARGARPLSIVGGYGLALDAYHPTAPDPMGRGSIRAMRAALEMAGVDVESVDYINGHGTGTPANDSMEFRAAIGLREGTPPSMSTTKSMVGHTLGAAGAVGAVTSVLAIRDQQLPPTATPDPDVPPRTDVDIVPGSARAARVRTVLENSFAFGGSNASLLLLHPDDRVNTNRSVRRAVVTGVSALAGDAPDTAALEAALAAGEPVYESGRVEFDGHGSFPLGEIPEAHLRRGVNPQHLRKMDALGRRAAVAAAELLGGRGLSTAEATGTGLIFATGIGPLSTVESFQRELIETGVGNKRLFPNTVMNAAAGHVALLNRLQGPTATICAGATSGLTALHFATRLIANGSCDRVIVLAADEAPEALVAGHLRIPGYLSGTAVRPFEGSGTVFGGAAVALLVEAEELTEPSRVLGEVRGFGLTGDRSGPGRIDTSGAAWARSFASALADARVSAEEIDVVVSAANGVAAVDRAERSALERSGLDAAALSAPKSVFGEIGSSAGLLGVAQAIWMSRRSEIAETDFALIRPTAPLRRRPQTSLISSYATGASYQSVIFSARQS